MAWRRVESRIDEVKVTHARLEPELFDLVGNEVRIARSVSPALHVSVSTVDALVDAPTLCLNRNCGAVPLIPGQIYPAMETRPGQRVEIRIFSGRSEHHCTVAIAHESGQSFDRSARGQRIYECDASALPVTCDSVINGEIAKQCLWSNSKRRASGDDLRAGSSLPKRPQNASRFGCVVTQRDCITVVDVPDRNAYDIGPESGRGRPCGRNCVGREAQIKKSDVVSCAFERRSDASETVWNHRIWLALAIFAHELNPRPPSLASLSPALH